MIGRLQRLKAKRGFSMVELIIVIAIIAIMSATALAGSSNRREKIIEANAAADDFYVALQAEFTNFQMFDGPLTMTLNKQYKNLETVQANNEFCGVKWFPAAGGNYPYEGYETGDDHQTSMPRDAALYVEMYAFGGTLRRVNYANDLNALIMMQSSSGNETAELCAVLLQEMKGRLEYRDGYYYARISYKAPGIPADPSQPLSLFDYRSLPVTVDWTAYCSKEVVNSDEVFQSQNLLSDNGVCGVHATGGYQALGTTGTSFYSAGINAA